MITNDKPHINSFDFDGTLTTGRFTPIVGVDVVVTGRCFNESKYVNDKLTELGADGIAVFFNTLHLNVRGDKTESARIKSAIHKVEVLTKLLANNTVTHYEDDPIQIEIIKGMLPLIEVVEVTNESKSFYGENNV